MALRGVTERTLVAAVFVLGLLTTKTALAAESDASPPAPKQEKPKDPNDDGFPDLSDFLDAKYGFLPIAMPITEPAVGYGLSPGLSFFHDKPQAINRPSASAPTPA